jgi:hypothetical protein
VRLIEICPKPLSASHFVCEHLSRSVEPST